MVLPQGIARFEQLECVINDADGEWASIWEDSPVSLRPGRQRYSVSKTATVTEALTTFSLAGSSASSWISRPSSRARLSTRGH